MTIIRENQSARQNVAVLLQSMDQVKRYDDPKLLNEYGDQCFS